MTRLLFAASAFLLIATTGCGTYSYPTPVAEVEDMKKNSHVYGDVDGGPYQAKLTYTADPNANDNALAIKAKMFGYADPTAAQPAMPTPSAADTTAKPAEPVGAPSAK